MSTPPPSCYTLTHHFQNVHFVILDSTDMQQLCSSINKELFGLEGLWPVSHEHTEVCTPSSTPASTLWLSVTKCSSISLKISFITTRWLYRLQIRATFTHHGAYFPLCTHLVYSLVTTIVGRLHGVTSQHTNLPPHNHPGCGRARLFHLAIHSNKSQLFLGKHAITKVL